jgi:hypothetical protein
MTTAPQEKLPAKAITYAQASTHRTPSIKHKPRPTRSYFDVGIGSVCLSGEDTGGAYCLLEAGLAPGIGVPRHTHTREDESYFVLAGEARDILHVRATIMRTAE